MKNKLLSGILAAAIVMAGGYYTWDSHLSPKAKAIQLVKQSLNDPGSAVFDRVRYVERTGATCGGVNAKNRMGGYVGMTAFIVDKGGHVTFAPTWDPESGPNEARIEALQEQISFLEKMEVCDVDSGA